jgi:hypothetical protein
MLGRLCAHVAVFQASKTNCNESLLNVGVVDAAVGNPHARYDIGQVGCQLVASLQ